MISLLIWLRAIWIKPIVLQSSILIMAQGCCIRHQGDGPRTLDGSSQLSLVLGTVAGYPPWYDFTAFCGKKPKCSWVLIINGKARVCTEPANLSPPKQSPLAFKLCHVLVPPVPWSPACSPALWFRSQGHLRSRLIRIPLSLYFHLSLVRQVRILIPVLWLPLSHP